MSKAELARKARISPVTVSRIEKGLPCRLETKRKIIPALGLKVSDKIRSFLNLIRVVLGVAISKRDLCYDVYCPSMDNGWISIIKTADKECNSWQVVLRV